MVQQRVGAWALASNIQPKGTSLYLPSSREPSVSFFKSYELWTSALIKKDQDYVHNELHDETTYLACVLHGHVTPWFSASRTISIELDSGIIKVHVTPKSTQLVKHLVQEGQFERHYNWECHCFELNEYNRSIALGAEYDLRGGFFFWVSDPSFLTTTIIHIPQAIGGSTLDQIQRGKQRRSCWTFLALYLTPRPS